VKGERVDDECKRKFKNLLIFCQGQPKPPLMTVCSYKPPQLISVSKTPNPKCPTEFAALVVVPSHFIAATAKRSNTSLFHNSAAHTPRSSEEQQGTPSSSHRQRFVLLEK
jgi:hypothetical protein